MRALRIPRSGSMILSMLTALFGVALLPIVFMAALASSAETHPRPLLDTLKDLGNPILTSIENLVDKLR